jgi:hypothetical protein
MSNSSATFDTGILVRRSLFFLVLIILAFGNIFLMFRGLNSPQAMDQAQIAREIARGNGFTTKFIRPVAYHQAESAAAGNARFDAFRDTYHSPLNPLVNAVVFKLIGADDADVWSMKENDNIYMLDRVVAMVCTLFFLMSIAVTYLLVSRIFDAKIAGVTALLMLFSQTFWDYSLSGLPQMLMLLLFSSAIYFVYRAVESAADGRMAMVPAALAGVFFTLLALTHWLAVWIALGYIIFAAIAFRPRGIVAITVLALLIIAAVGPMIRNHAVSGTPFGTAFLTLYGGLGGDNADLVMRMPDLDGAPLNTQRLVSKIARTTLLQATDIIPFLAGIIIAPLFFISLLHPFKRAAIANFRWAILLMWVSGALGLAFFGITTEPLDSNQIHLLFAPVMTAYGLAFVSILWGRLDVVATAPMLRNFHHFVIVCISALPLVLATPQRIQLGIERPGGVPQWPPYYAQPLNLTLREWVTENEIVFSDQPWAVAWYADRMSIWLPPTVDAFNKLEEAAADLQTPVTGIHISPSSHGSKPIGEMAGQYRDFTSLVIDGRVFLSTYPPGFSIYDKDPKIQAITSRYQTRVPMVGMDMLYYSNRTVRPISN